MSFLIGHLDRPIRTPCIGVCELDEAGRCLGCYRSVDEIAGWSSLGEAERERLIHEVLPRRALGDDP